MFSLHNFQIISPGQLTIKDLPEVRDALWSARSKWLDIGIELGIDKSELDSIEESSRGDPSKCLTSVVSHYLEKSSYTRSWSGIVEALKSPYIGHDYLAHQLESRIVDESKGDVESVAANVGVAAAASPSKD